MSKKQSLAAGLAMAAAVTLVASTGDAASRLQWEVGGGTVSWHRACAFVHPDPAETAQAHRFVTLRGSLRALARGDVALYAIFLEDQTELDDLREQLHTGAGPTAPEVETYEWLALGQNGNITLRIDEAHRPGKNLLAVVNGDGEILGLHPLWESNGDLAALRTH